MSTTISDNESRNLAVPPAADLDTLAAVRRSIPDFCYNRSTKKSMIYVVRDFAIYAALIAAMVLVKQWYFDIPLILLTGVVVGGLFILGHDGAHGALTDSKKINGVSARLLMLPSLHVQESWVLGHNRVHHGFTARQGMDFVWHPVTVEEYQQYNLFKKLRHRIEWSPFGAGLYYLREVWWNKMITFRPPEKWAKAIWRDWWLVAGWAIFATVASLVGGFFDYGSVAGTIWMWFKLVVGPFFIFNQVIGWTVYVHHVGPDIRWWKKNEWTRFRGQMESTTIMRFPWLANQIFHNIFIHVPHHVDMRIPWYELPRAADAIEAAFPGTVVDEKFSLVRYFKSAHTCKLYDFEQGKWLPYGASKENSPARVPSKNTAVAL